MYWRRGESTACWVAAGEQQRRWRSAKERKPRTSQTQTGLERKQPGVLLDGFWLRGSSGLYTPISS